MNRKLLCLPHRKSAILNSFDSKSEFEFRTRSVNKQTDNFFFKKPRNYETIITPTETSHKYKNILTRETLILLL